MGAMSFKITILTIGYWPFVWGIHRWQVNSPHKWLVTRNMFPIDDIILERVIHFYPAALKAPGYCRTPSGRAGGRADGRAGGRQGRQAALTLSRP